MEAVTVRMPPAQAVRAPAAGAAGTTSWAPHCSAESRAGLAGPVTLRADEHERGGIHGLPFPVTLLLFSDLRPSNRCELE